MFEVVIFALGVLSCFGFLLLLALLRPKANGQKQTGPNSRSPVRENIVVVKGKG